MRLLQLKPQIRQNWTALAVGHHLQGDPARAVQILAAFEDTLKVGLIITITKYRLHHQETIKNTLKRYYIETPYLLNTTFLRRWNTSTISKILYVHLELYMNSRRIISPN
jgi:hypothetical protein